MADAAQGATIISISHVRGRGRSTKKKKRKILATEDSVRAQLVLMVLKELRPL